MNLSAEQAVLGACIAYGTGAMALATDRGIDEDSWATDSHRHLWQLMVALDEQAKPVELLSVCLAIEADDRDIEVFGGLSYVSALPDRVCSVGSVPHYAEKVLDSAARRRIDLAAEWAKTAAGQGVPVGDIVAHLAGMLDRVEGQAAAETADGAAIAAAAWRALSEPTAGSASLGDPAIDDIWAHGLVAGRTTVIAARPAMGKTAIGQEILLRAATQGHAGLMFSMEQPLPQLAIRWMAQDTQIPIGRFSAGYYMTGGLRERMRVIWEQLDQRERDEVGRHLARMGELPLHVDCTTLASLPYIRSKTVRLNRKLEREKGQGLRIVLVDYIQRAQLPRAAKHHQALGLFCKRMADLARATAPAVFLHCQLNRSIEGGHRLSPGCRI